MVTLVETKKHFDQFSESYQNADRVLLIPIFKDLNKNASVNTISLVFVSTENHSFLLCFDHCEAKNLDLKYLEIFQDKTTKYVFDKKELFQYANLPNLVDIKLLHWFDTNKNLDYSYLPNHFFNFQYSAPKIKASYLPIYQVADKCFEVSHRGWEIINSSSGLEEKTPFKYYNQDVIKAFSKIESNGLKIDDDLFNSVFREKLERNHSDLVYTDYNIYTSTGRPSNANHNVNFAALNSDQDQLKPFISRFEDGGLILMDYDAFHLRLIGKLCGYKLPDESFHSYLGKKYFDKDEITQEEYEESKKISFQLLYGEDIDEARNLEYFDKTYNLKQNIWKIYKKHGYIQTPKFRRQISGSHIPRLSPGKAFSYVLQSYETEFNVNVIQRLFDLLENYKTKLVLYTYDSLLFDFCKADGRDLIYQIKDEMEGKEMKVKVYTGKNYGKLKQISL